MYNIIWVFKKARLANFADMSKLQPWLLKQPLKNVFLDITKVAGFLWKNADVSRTQEVCHVIYIFFGFTLSKV